MTEKAMHKVGYRFCPTMLRRRNSVSTLVLLFMIALFGSPIAEAQTFTVLHNFGVGTDGAYPRGALLLDGSGNLYGTTSGGGTAKLGTLFEIDRSGKETILYSFKGGTDGSSPASGLITDHKGHLYGTTYTGGNPNCDAAFGGCGTVFKFDLRSGQETVLYSFAGSPDGKNPLGGLVMDASGNLYGTTFQGGALNCITAQEGCGVVFKLDSQGNETVLYTFLGAPDSANPTTSLTLDAQGDMYGTTDSGGDLNCSPNYGGCGTVFKLSQGHNRVLHRFAGYPTDGETPESPVIVDGLGNVYGSTSVGGSEFDGTLFRISAGGMEHVYSFTGSFTANEPIGPMLRDNHGNVYGASLGGGFYLCGTIFEISSSGRDTSLHDFECTDGTYPMSGLIRDSAGNVYGTTYFGGSANAGVVFKLSR